MGGGCSRAGAASAGRAWRKLPTRELMEEAGCTVAGDITWFASFTVTNPGRPWRPWHPFPITAWLVGAVAVERVGLPTNPPDGERVVAVHTLPALEARRYLSGFDNGGQADLVSLAAELGHLNTSPHAGVPPSSRDG